MKSNDFVFFYFFFFLLLLLRLASNICFLYKLTKMVGLFDSTICLQKLFTLLENIRFKGSPERELSKHALLVNIRIDVMSEFVAKAF